MSVTELPGTRRSAPSKRYRWWRIAIVAGVVLVVVNLFVYLGMEADTTSSSQDAPSLIDQLVPEDGAIIRPQEEIAADLRNDLFGVLVVDGREIPEDQLLRVEPLGRVQFRPGPGREFERWDPGTHRVTVLSWPRGEERPERPASFAWTFRSA